ncbi:MAG: ABC transporter substrate-binding protein [Lachnospiraceae bacterium]|nr:ABC transporter substrate-binding protein [Lachnospiraceae bacterium]
MKKTLAAVLAVGLALSSTGTALAEESTSAATYEGSVMNIGVTSSTASWNPFTGTGSSTGVGQASTMIYETLMDLSMNPVLAYDYEKIDDVTYDFYIWDNIVDSQGNAITASDVVFSYEQAIAGGNAHGISIIDTVTAVDDYTVEFTFTHEPYIGDLESVAGQVAIISQAAYEASEDNMATEPIGTGPYVLTEWVPDSITTVTVRDDYWASEDQIGSDMMKSNIETVNFVVISEASQSTIALENGTIDYSANITTADLTFFEEGGVDSENYYVEQLAQGLTTVLLANMSEDSILGDNQALREAVFYAIDVPSIIVGASSGNGIITYDASNASLSDYNTEWNDEDNYYHYNVETAQEKLAEAGYSSGEVSLTLFCESGDEYTNMATLIQAFLANIGINVEIEAYDSAILNEYAADSTQWDLILSLTGSEDYIVNSWAHLFDPENYSNGMSINFIDDQEMFDLLNLCKTYDGHTEENLNAFHEYITGNAVAMGLYNSYTNSVVNRKYELSYTQQMSIIPQATVIVE